MAHIALDTAIVDIQGTTPLQNCLDKSDKYDVGCTKDLEGHWEWM